MTLERELKHVQTRQDLVEEISTMKNISYPENTMVVSLVSVHASNMVPI